MSPTIPLPEGFDWRITKIPRLPVHILQLRQTRYGARIIASTIVPAISANPSTHALDQAATTLLTKIPYYLRSKFDRP